MKKWLALFLVLMLALPMGASAASTYTINYSFENRKDDVAQLNALLGSMKLADLEWEEYKTYLSTTTDGAGHLISRRLGLSSGYFVCTLAENDDGHTYQIMTDVVELSQDHDQFVNNWRDSHPDLTVRVVIRVEYDTCAGYVIIYHERANTVV